MKNILVISYLFPPSIKSGVQRAVKMALHLPNYNWRPFVLTTAEPHSDRMDPQALLPLQNTHITRAPEFFPFKNKKGKVAKAFLRHWRLVTLIDIHVGWIPFAYRRALQLVKSHKIDLVFVTGFPFSSFWIAYLLNKKTGIPYVLDYRDPWLSNPDFTRRKPRFLLRRFEKKCLDRCALYFGTTPAVVETVGRPYGAAIRQKGRTFTYGFDLDEFPADRDAPPAAGHPIRLFSMGSTYDPGLCRRFVSALERLYEQGEIGPGNFKFVFYGNFNLDGPLPETLRPMMDLHPYAPRRVVLDEMTRCHGYVLLHGSGPIVAQCYPGRMFEYFAAGGPIFYVGPPGIAAETIVKSGLGTAAADDNPAAIAQGLATFIGRIGAGDFRPDHEKTARFEIGAVIAQFAAHLEESFAAGPGQGAG